MEKSIGIALAIDPWSLWFWLFIGVILAGIVSWILSALLARRRESSEAIVAAGTTVTIFQPLHGDQLEAIDGVGPETAELFRKSQKYRFIDVAEMTVPDIQSM